MKILCATLLATTVGHTCALNLVKLREASTVDAVRDCHPNGPTRLEQEGICFEHDSRVFKPTCNNGETLVELVTNCSDSAEVLESFTKDDCVNTNIARFQPIECQRPEQYGVVNFHSPGSACSEVLAALPIPIILTQDECHAQLPFSFRFNGCDQNGGALVEIFGDEDCTVPAAMTTSLSNGLCIDSSGFEEVSFQLSGECITNGEETESPTSSVTISPSAGDQIAFSVGFFLLNLLFTQ